MRKIGKVGDAAERDAAAVQLGRERETCKTCCIARIFQLAYLIHNARVQAGAEPALSHDSCRVLLVRGVRCRSRPYTPLFRWTLVVSFVMFVTFEPLVWGCWTAPCSSLLHPFPSQPFIATYVACARCNTLLLLQGAGAHAWCWHQSQPQQTKYMWINCTKLRIGPTPSASQLLHALHALQAERLLTCKSCIAAIRGSHDAHALGVCYACVDGPRDCVRQVVLH